MVARGASAFPFVKFGETDFIIGYNPDAFARLLGLPKDADKAGESGSCERSSRAASEG